MNFIYQPGCAKVEFMKEPRIPYVTRQSTNPRPSVQIDMQLLEEQVAEVNRLQAQLDSARLNRNKTIWRLVGRLPRATIARLAGMSQQALFKVINSAERYQHYKEQA